MSLVAAGPNFPSRNTLRHDVLPDAGSKSFKDEVKPWFLALRHDFVDFEFEPPLKKRIDSFLHGPNGL